MARYSTWEDIMSAKAQREVGTGMPALSPGELEELRAGELRGKYESNVRERGMKLAERAQKKQEEAAEAGSQAQLVSGVTQLGSTAALTAGMLGWKPFAAETGGKGMTAAEQAFQASQMATQPISEIGAPAAHEAAYVGGMTEAGMPLSAGPTTYGAGAPGPLSTTPAAVQSAAGGEMAANAVFTQAYEQAIANGATSAEALNVAYNAAPAATGMTNAGGGLTSQGSALVGGESAATAGQVGVGTGGGPTWAGAGGVMAIIAAADMIRQWQGGLDKDFGERNPWQKYTAAPGNLGALPAYLSNRALGIGGHTFVGKMTDLPGRIEERLVGRPLDKLLKGDIGGSFKEFGKGIKGAFDDIKDAFGF